MAAAAPTSPPLDNVPLSPAAQQYFEQTFKPRLAAMQQQIAQTPLMILVWGPGPSKPDLYNKRVQIRNALREQGMAAFFSEDLMETKPADESQKGIEFLQATAADLVVVMAVSYGSIGEVHDFSDYQVINAKMLIFIDDAAADWYSYQGALTELKTLYNNVYKFHSPDDITSCHLKTIILEKLRVMQMLKWRATVNAQSWGLVQNVAAAA
jgi:hypothetical protein